MRCALISTLAVIFISLNSGVSASDAIYQDQVRPFLDTYCLSCHGAEKQKADRRYDTLPATMSSVETMGLWQDIVDQLNKSEMPPEKSKQPTNAERMAVINWASDALQKAHSDRRDTGGQVVMRRLNRAEYEGTVRDVLALPDMRIELTRDFPPDETANGFDNQGAILVMSDFLLSLYLETARMLIDKAITTEEQPKSQIRTFAAPFYKREARPDSMDVPGKYQNLRENPFDKPGYLFLSRLPTGVEADGQYRIRIKAEALYHNYKYPEDMVGVSKSDPFRLQVVSTATSDATSMEINKTSDRVIEIFDLSDQGPKWYEATTWLDVGYAPRMTFINGPISTKHLRGLLLRKFPEMFKKTIHSKNKNDWMAFHGEYEGPRIRIHEITIEGPLATQWPPASRLAVLGDLQPTMSNAKAIISRFADRAYRRPATETELQPILKMMQARLANGDTPLMAIKSGLAAILCSPAFLYRIERSDALDQTAIATRLSYFLWGTGPDSALIADAQVNRLQQSSGLRTTTERLLNDARSQYFIDQFTNRWLELYKLGSMPPSIKGNDEDALYFTDNLESAMRTETRMFFSHILQNNLPISQFLDTDYTFLNGPLARHYGITGVTGNEFRLVKLSDKRRGGLLGQGSILTASANGVDTSPVIRGIWVLNNIFGSHPPPPPPDVEPLEPDIRGATTIREQLVKHRTVATCNECHRKIDPLGFALENYDEIGRWRTSYGGEKGEKGKAVDPSGQLPDGRSFNDIISLKELLLSSKGKDQFAHCLTEKLLTYALGRPMDVTDRPDIDRIIAAHRAAGGGLKELVLLVASSPGMMRK